jgi:hypothetical protein
MVDSITVRQWPKLRDTVTLIFFQISRTLSEFFQDLDVVPSDIAAGLVLLRHIQKREENRLVYQSLANVLMPARLVGLKDFCRKSISCCSSVSITNFIYTG